MHKEWFPRKLKKFRFEHYMKSQLQWRESGLH